jgi:hypothetical protein
MVEETASAKATATESPTAKGRLDQVGQQAREVRSQTVSAAADIAHEAQARSASLVGDLKDRAASAAEDGKASVAERLDDTAKALHRSGEQLEGHQDWVAHLVERGADELGILAATLRTNDLQGLLSKLQDLSRRQPAVFVGATMAAGFAAVRVGKLAAAGTSRADPPHPPEMTREPS